jgi:hypothetical protein
MEMAYDLGVWLAGLILLMPVVIFGLAWARIKRFYQARKFNPQQRYSYLIALIAASISTLAYISYWTWRVFELYHAIAPFAALLALERSIYVGKALSLVALGCLLIGRGPFRIPVLVGTAWVAFQLWTHGNVIHWLERTAINGQMA